MTCADCSAAHPIIFTVTDKTGRTFLLCPKCLRKRMEDV